MQRSFHEVHSHLQIKPTRIGALSESILLSVQPRLNPQEMASERGGYLRFLIYLSQETLATKSS